MSYDPDGDVSAEMDLIDWDGVTDAVDEMNTNLERRG